MRERELSAFSRSRKTSGTFLAREQAFLSRLRIASESSNDDDGDDDDDDDDGSRNRAVVVVAAVAAAFARKETSNFTSILPLSLSLSHSLSPSLSYYRLGFLQFFFKCFFHILVAFDIFLSFFLRHLMTMPSIILFCVFSFVFLSNSFSVSSFFLTLSVVFKSLFFSLLHSCSRQLLFLTSPSARARSVLMFARIFCPAVLARARAAAAAAAAAHHFEAGASRLEPDLIEAAETVEAGTQPTSRGKKIT